MALTSLVICNDAKTVQALTRILMNLDMRVEHCGNAFNALERFTKDRFDAVLIDCENEPAAIAFLSEIHLNHPDHQAIVIAIVDSRNNAREIFAKGANFVLYKPVSDDRIAKSMAAAQTLIRTEKRLTKRIPLNANASIAYANTENEIIRVVDLSADGIAIYSPKPLPRNCKIYFQFSLPGETSTIRLSCEVIWQNEAGNTGLRFAAVPTSSRKVLDYWIKNKVGKELQIANSTATGTETSDDLRQQLTASLSLISVSTQDRRRQPRHQCTLGAEVCRAGSNIQQRCVVSDLCAGGCYVQTSEPLPVGTPIEITLRTQEIKLKIPGTVQSVHRALGMGVQFTTSNPPDEMKRLIAEVQSQQVPV